MGGDTKYDVNDSNGLTRVSNFMRASITENRHWSIIIFNFQLSVGYHPVTDARIDLADGRCDEGAVTIHKGDDCDRGLPNRPILQLGPWPDRGWHSRNRRPGDQDALFECYEGYDARPGRS